MLWQTVVNGLVAGGTYALFAVGFTLIFGIHKILNLAHGYVFTVGALSALLIVRDASVPWWVGLLIGMVAGGVLSVVIDFVAFRPLQRKNAPEASLLMASIGIGLVLQSITQQLSDSKVQRFPQDDAIDGTLAIAGATISRVQLLIIILAIVLTLLLALHLRFTLAGKNAKAVAEDERTARLMGIRPSWVHAQTFFIAGAFAGVAGVLIATAFNSVSFVMGEPYLLIAMAVITVGGLGSVTGAFIGAIGLGIIQTLTVNYVGASLSQAVPFVLLFLVLVIRPQGLLGQAAIEARAGRH